MGGGQKLKLLEDKTKIIISKSRSVSHGGTSFERYRRSINASILVATREVKKKLDEHGFDYDLTFKKGRGGLEKSIFTVYVSREKLHGIIKPFKNKNVKLVIKPVYRNRIVLSEPETHSRRGVILGVDPGIYTGIALVDLSGRPILLYSSKNLDRSDIINMVTSMGKVIMVATDVAHPPETVKKIAASLNAELYLPHRDLSNDDKREIIASIKKRYPQIEVEDTHERDALAAAYTAYLSIAEKMKQVENKIHDMNIDLDIERIKINVARGTSIAEAIEKEIDRILESEGSRGKWEEVSEQNHVEHSEEITDRIIKLHSRISKLIAENRSLRRKLREKDRIIEELRIELNALKRDLSPHDNLMRKINELQMQNKMLLKRINELNEQLERYRGESSRLESLIDRLSSNKYIAIIKLRNLGALTNNIMNKLLGETIGVRAVYIVELTPFDPEKIGYLRSKRIAIISSTQKIDPLKFMEKYRVPLIDISKYEHFIYNEYIFIDRRVIEDVEKSWKYIDELNSEDEYRRIIDLVTRYKEERRRMFGEKYDEFLE